MTANKTRPVQATAPKRIYLQGGPQLPENIDFSALSEVTWCRDDVDGTGIPYVRADLAGAAPAAVAPVLDVTLDEEQAGLLRDMLGDPAEYEEALTVRLIVCDGHSGHGLYVAQAEYQDEGAVLLASLPAPAAPALEAPAAPAAPKREVTDGTRTLLEDCISAIRDYAGSRPEEGESWESWFEAAFDLCQSRVRRVFDDHALAAAPQAPAAPAEAQRLAQFLQDRQTCLGSSRASAGKYNQESWDDYERAWTMLLGMAAPAAPSAIATQVIENLLQLARIVNTAVEDWGETKEDDSMEVIFHKEEADKMESILEFFDSLPDAPAEEGVIESGPLRAARVLRAQAAPAAPAVDARESARYRLLRRGQHWSVIDGKGDVLRGDELDATIDARLAAQAAAKGEHDAAD